MVFFLKVTSFMNKYAFRFLIIWICILSCLYTTLSLLLYQHFNYGGFDLGVLDQAIWQYSRFISSYSTVYEKLIFGIHFTPSLILFAPLYWLWNDVRMLIIFEAIWMSFSAIAIYKLALLRKISPILALSIAFAYSLFWGIQQGISVEFHPMVFGAGLLAWFAYFFETGNKRWMWISLIVFLGLEEVMGVFLAGLGVFYLFHAKYRVRAFWLIIGGIIYALVAIQIVSRFSPEGYEHYPQLSLDPITNVIRLFDHPAKRQIWLFTISSFSFLSLLSPGTMLAMLVYLGQWFVSLDTGYPFSASWTLHTYHYAGLGILLALGAMDILSFLTKKHISSMLLALIMMIFVVISSSFLQFPLSSLMRPAFWNSEPWMEDAFNLFARIPPERAIAAQASFLPYLSHRREIYQLHVRQKLHACGAISCWWIDFDEKSQYLIVSRLEGMDLPSIEVVHFQEALGNMERAGKIKIVDREGSTIEYKIL